MTKALRVAREACGLGEHACRAFQFGEPGGEGGDAQPVWQGFAELQAVQRFLVPGRHRRCAVSAVAVVHMSRVRSVESDGTVVEVSFLVRDADRGTTAHPAGTVIGCGGVRGWTWAGYCTNATLAVTEFSEHPPGALHDLHLWVGAQQHVPRRTGEAEARAADSR